MSNLNDFEKDWYNNRKNQLISKGAGILILFILTFIFGLAATDFPTHSERTTILLFMFTITALPTIYLTTKFLRQWSIKSPYAQQLVFLSTQDKKIGYSTYYNRYSNKTVIIVLSETIVIRIRLSGHWNKNNVHKFLENKLIEYHGDLSKFPIHKNLAKKSL